MTNPSNLTLRIRKIHCFLSDELNLDEVFLKYKGKRIWPAKKKYEQLKIGEAEVDVRIEDIEPHSSVEIELWDYDTWSRNDLLGKFNMKLDEKGGPYSTDMVPLDTKTARYNLEWEIV